MEPAFKKPEKWSDLIDIRDIIHHPAHYTVLTTNLVMLIGLLVLGWNGQTIVAAYFLETIIIGAFNVVKLFMIVRYNPHPDDPNEKGVSGIAVIPFFILHYGFFIYVQMIFFLGFASALDPALKGMGGGFTPHMLTYFKIILGNNFWFITGNFVIGQLVYLTTVFLYRKDYQTRTLGTQMMVPYARIFVQQFTVIISGFFLIVINSGMVIALLLITFKTLADIAVIQWELKSGKKNGTPNPFNRTGTNF